MSFNVSGHFFSQIQLLLNVEVGALTLGEIGAINLRLNTGTGVLQCASLQPVLHLHVYARPVPLIHCPPLEHGLYVQG